MSDTPEFSVEFPTLLGWVRVEGTDSAVKRIRLNHRGGKTRPGIVVDRAAKELSQYLAGQREEFSFEFSPEGTPFQMAVWGALRKIPYGKTMSYSEVASKIGKPGASRAVGSAVGKNPLPLLIPCHRVLAANKKLGGFTGGTHLKRKLLTIENIPFTEN